ncbi:titin-like isoform X1 [Ceratina calcarata]|uniref:protein kinase C n=1 Tax=Ceratina calcarata TaxID=156304 RepID=A0AAJ7JHT2_9HYME|nr:titin-like isoform X1 [Ceratina calcarata]
MPYYGDGLPYYYGGAFSNHSSLMTGAPRPFHTPLSRYSPHLSTISESPLSTLRRYSPSPVVSRPRRVIDTADIDVSTPRIHTTQDTSQQRNHLRRDRPTIKIRCQALKDNPALREHYEKHEKSVSELLLEKYLIKDKKLEEEEKRLQLFHQVSLETDEDEDELQQMKNKVRRRFTRRRSSADIQLDPEQIEREVAYAQVQAKVLDTLVAEEQAEIENEVRRGTLIKKGSIGGPRTVPGFFRNGDGEPVSQEEDEAAAQKMKTLKKLKKKKKSSNKPSPPGDNRECETSSEMSGDVQTSENDEEEARRQPRLFKVEASNSVGDFSTVLVNSGPVEQFRESVRIPVPKKLMRPGRFEVEEESETEIVLPVKKPYVKDTSRNSVHFTVKTPTDTLKSDPLKKLEIDSQFVQKSEEKKIYDAPSEVEKNKNLKKGKGIPKKDETEIAENKVKDSPKSVAKTVLDKKATDSSVTNEKSLDSTKSPGTFVSKHETTNVLEKKTTDVPVTSVSSEPTGLSKKSPDSQKFPDTSVVKNEVPSVFDKKIPDLSTSKNEATASNKMSPDSPKSSLNFESKKETSVPEKKTTESPGSPLSKSPTILDKKPETPVLNKKSPDYPKSPLTIESKKETSIAEQKIVEPPGSPLTKTPTILDKKPETPVLNKKSPDSPKSPLTIESKKETFIAEKKIIESPGSPLTKTPTILDKKPETPVLNKKSLDSPKSPLTIESKKEISVAEKKVVEPPGSPLTKSPTILDKKPEAPVLNKKSPNSPKSPLSIESKKDISVAEKKIVEPPGSPLTKTPTILDKKPETPVLNKKSLDSPKSSLKFESKKETSVPEKKITESPGSPLTKTPTILDKKPETPVLNKKSLDSPKSSLKFESKKETSVPEKKITESPGSPLTKTPTISDKKPETPILIKKSPDSPKSLTSESKKETSIQVKKTVDTPGSPISKNAVGSDKKILDKKWPIGPVTKNAAFPDASKDVEAKRIEERNVTVIVDPLSRPSSASVAEAEERLPKASKINTDENNAVEAPKRWLREPTECLPAVPTKADVRDEVASSPFPGKNVDEAVTLRNAHATIGAPGERSKRNDSVASSSPDDAIEHVTKTTLARKSDAQKTDSKENKKKDDDKVIKEDLKSVKESKQSSSTDEKMPSEKLLLNGGTISKSASTESIDFWNEIRGPESPQVTRPKGFAFSKSSEGPSGQPVEDLGVVGLDKKKETGAKISVATPPSEFSNIPVIEEESSKRGAVSTKPEPAKKGLKKRKDLSIAIDTNKELYSTIKKAPVKREDSTASTTSSKSTPDTCLPVSEASTPVFDVSVPLINIVQEPTPTKTDSQPVDEEDEPKTPTNEWSDGVQPRISKWNNHNDLSNVDDAEKDVTPVPSKDVSVNCTPEDTPESSKKKKLVRKKKSSTTKKASKKDSKKASKDSKKNSSKSQEVIKPVENKTGAKNSPKNAPVQRPVDLIRMFYTTPSALLTATPRDLSKVRRAKIKRKKHHSRTPSVSSDSTGSTTSTATTGSSSSTCTELDDDPEHKRINSTRSNDSGFDGSPRISTPSQSSDTQRNSDSSDHFPSGRITPPATNLPRFKKYAVTDFNFLKVLGKGSFGKVLLAELRGTECVYAVKCLKKDVVLEDDDVECTLIERKVLTLATRHPYLCHLFCTFQTDSHLFFVMEYLNGGDLMFHIQKSGRFPEARARFYAAEIWSGLIFLHKKGIVYRDLKLDNVLLDFEGHIRIADFGMCKLQIFLDRTADSFCGTPDYMAPEIIKGLKYNQAVDWWSYGVLLYEMLTGQSPFSGCDEEELFWSICNERPFIPRYLGQEATDILVALLEKDSGKRLPGHEIAVHSFFHQIQWDRLERRTLDPPFKPALEHTLDTKYFDTAFTAERPRLTPVPDQILTSMDQGVFRGFSYTNPNATD